MLLAGLLMVGIVGSIAEQRLHLMRYFNVEDTLVLAQVIFKHGGQTPVASLKFSNMPYVDETFRPYGLGQLTLKGKRNSYSLGKDLWRRYGNFLGPTYNPNLVEAVSSECDRTIMSLQAVLSAMFKPSKEHQIKHGLDWQPVIQKYISWSEDKTLALSVNCPKVFELVSDIDHDTRMVRNYLSSVLGANINSSLMTYGIQNNFQVLEELGYPLPDWVRPIWPEPLTTVANKLWKEIVQQKLPLAAGHLMSTLNENMLKKINGTDLDELKMFIYAGHDINVIAVLGALGVYDGSHINYCAHVIIELHYIEGEYFVKAFFQNHRSGYPSPIHIPSCGHFCPLYDFFAITQRSYPQDKWCY